MFVRVCFTDPKMSLRSIFILLSALLAVQSLITTSAETAYDILASYDFPVGLLPKGVVKYDIDRNTGRFHAYLNDSCSFSLEGSYQLKYKSTISGYIEKDKLTGLTGISVKVLFFWLNIVEVSRNGDELYFSVGITSASFPIDNFYECPQCGCGLDCVNGGGGKDAPLDASYSLGAEEEAPSRRILFSNLFYTDDISSESGKEIGDDANTDTN